MNTPWHTLSNLGNGMYVMTRYHHEVANYAPLYCFSFRLIAPRKILEAQQFIRRYHSFDEIDNVPDRLRWRRHEMGLMQKEVAARVGISRYRYIQLETGLCQAYHLDVLDKLSTFYNVPLDCLLDDYNRFLAKGQAQQLTDCREHTGLSRREFAAQTGIPETSLREWEEGRKRISRASWEKYYRGKIEP